MGTGGSIGPVYPFLTHWRIIIEKRFSLNLNNISHRLNSIFGKKWPWALWSIYSVFGGLDSCGPISTVFRRNSKLWSLQAGVVIDNVSFQVGGVIIRLHPCSHCLKMYWEDLLWAILVVIVLVVCGVCVYIKPVRDWGISTFLKLLNAILNYSFVFEFAA